MERDPYDKDPHELGAKLDAGKVRADTFLGHFANALDIVARVGEYGAAKYTVGGWQAVPDGISRYGEAAMRHWLARKQGEECDAESGLLHLAHEAWNKLAELELVVRQIREQRSDSHPVQDVHNVQEPQAVKRAELLPKERQAGEVRPVVPPVQSKAPHPVRPPSDRDSW